VKIEQVDKETARTFGRVVGILIIVLGVVGFWQERSRPTGILSWLTGPIFELTGSTGIAVFYVVVGVCLLIALRKKAKEE